MMNGKDMRCGRYGDKNVPQGETKNEQEMHEKKKVKKDLWMTKMRNEQRQREANERKAVVYVKKESMEEEEEEEKAIE